MEIRLSPMTRERMHKLFEGFVYDPVIFQDMSLYEQVKSSGYDPKRVDALFDSRFGKEDRRSFAVMLGDRVISEAELKHIDQREKTCELGIHLQSDAFKNKGYGTQAEQLAVAYAFETLGMDRILADTVAKNTRSQHVLEKLGFTLAGEENGFIYYRQDKAERRT